MQDYFDHMLNPGQQEMSQQQATEMAAQLRRQKNLTTLMQLSGIPNVNALGKSRAGSEHERVNKLSALNTSRRAAEAARNKRGAPRTYLNDEKAPSTYTQDGAGVMHRESVLDGMTPVSKTALGKQVAIGTLKKDTLGNAYEMKETGWELFKSEGQGLTDAQRMSGIAGDAEAATAGKVQLAKEEAKAFVSETTDLKEAYASMRLQQPHLKDAIDALESGANTGAIARLLFSWKDDTKKLEAAMDAMALPLLKLAKLAPTSDKDVAWLKSVAVPDGLDDDQLLAWLGKRLEGMKRYMQANSAEIEYRQRYGRRPPPEMTDDILYGGGFSYEQDSVEDVKSGHTWYNLNTFPMDADITTEEWDGFKEDEKVAYKAALKRARQ